MSTRTASSVLAVTLALVAVLTGVRTGNKALDTDEDVYQRTLRSMRSGEGYYRSMSDALLVKEKARPSSVRAIRPPTLFLVLRWFPERSWRWIVGLVYLAMLLALARLGEPYGRYGGVVATVAGGVWVIGASSYLYLHAELWGLPFFLAGLVAVRRENDSNGAALLAVATALRELYGVGLLLGVLMSKRRRPWLLATAVIIALAAVHIWLAHSVLASAGHEVGLGNERITIHSILRFLSPGDRPAAFALGVTMLAAGFMGMARNLRRDRAATILLPFSIILLVAGVAATRTYWNLTYGPAVSAFCTAAVAAPSYVALNQTKNH
jgi:hypothetical protein